MSALRSLRVPIGHEAQVRARAGAQHRLGVWRPPVCRPARPFARIRYQRETGGEPVEIVTWLPGPHPEDAAWWEDLGLWVLVHAA
jgi:hypothetical protein